MYNNLIISGNDTPVHIPSPLGTILFIILGMHILKTPRPIALNTSSHVLLPDQQ